MIAGKTKTSAPSIGAEGKTMAVAVVPREEPALPHEGQEYWWVSDRGIVVGPNTWLGDALDFDRWHYGNVHSSERAARAYALRTEAMAKTYWLPRHTQRYYYYNLAYEMVTINYWHGSSDDLGRYWLGNIHQTLEQATTYARNFAGAFGLPSEFDGGQGDASA